MSGKLSRLRWNLDVMPSPLEDQPGLLIRDPFRYSTDTILIPAPLVPLLPYFDGRRTRAELLEAMDRAAPGHDVAELVSGLEEALSASGFLDDAQFGALRETRHREFAEARVRSPAHAGSSYPEEADALAELMGRWLYGGRQPAARVGAIAAPHVSPEGGWLSYRAAYRVLDDDLADRTFVVLGTSHYGEPDRFGLTRKPYVTPFGACGVDFPLVDRLIADAGDAVVVEDYCHAVEHSIEFQVLFLQQLYGPGVKILPILCGALATVDGAAPARPAPFFGALGELAAREGDRLRWVLGIDMAHVGRRYGDDLVARADDGPLREVARQDRERIDRIAAGDAAGFWDLVSAGGEDALRWCGTSPVYTFLRALPQARGELLRYDQWNIDEQSVVSFAGMSFRL